VGLAANDLFAVVVLSLESEANDKAIYALQDRRTSESTDGVYRCGARLCVRACLPMVRSRIGGIKTELSLPDEITVSAPCERVDLEALKATRARRRGLNRIDFKAHCG